MSEIKADLDRQRNASRVISYVTDPRRRKLLVAAFVVFGMFFALCWVLSEKRIKQFDLGNRTTLSIYWRPSLEPQDPSYSRCEIVRNGELLVPKREIFLGHERPSKTFAVERSTTTPLVALTYDGDVVFIHDLYAGHTWPDLRFQTDEMNYPFLVKSLAVFQAEGENLRCSRRRYFEEEQRKLKLKNQNK